MRGALACVKRHATLAALLLALVRVDSEAPPSSGLAVGYDDLTDGLHHFMDTQATDTTLPCETSTHHEVLHSETGIVQWSNLNGLGPDTNASQSLRVNHVGTTADGKEIDMQLVAGEDYTSDLPSLNGMDGMFGTINHVHPHSKTSDPAQFRLTYSFLVDETSSGASGSAAAVSHLHEEYLMEHLTVYIYDLDTLEDGSGKQCVTFHNTFIDYHLSKTTQIFVTGDVYATKFCATKHGELADRPTDPHALTALQSDRTVAVRFADVSEFSIFPSLSIGTSSRNLLYYIERKNAAPCSAATPTPTPATHGPLPTPLVTATPTPGAKATPTPTPSSPGATSTPTPRTTATPTPTASGPGAIPTPTPAPVTTTPAPTASALPSTGTVVLTLTAGGSVSDYSDTSALQSAIAASAGVDASLVTISVAAGSVLITATIAVPASSTPAAVQTSLGATLGTAAAASTALGVALEAVPTILIASPPPPSPPSPPSLPSPSMGDAPEANQATADGPPTQIIVGALAAAMVAAALGAVAYYVYRARGLAKGATIAAEDGSFKKPPVDLEARKCSERGSTGSCCALVEPTPTSEECGALDVAAVPRVAAAAARRQQEAEQVAASRQRTHRAPDERRAAAPSAQGKPSRERHERRASREGGERQRTSAAPGEAPRESSHRKPRHASPGHGRERSSHSSAKSQSGRSPHI